MCPLKKNEDYESEKQEVKRDRMGSTLLTASAFQSDKQGIANGSINWRFPKIRGTFGGVPIVRIIIFWVYIGIPPFMETPN